MSAAKTAMAQAFRNEMLTLLEKRDRAKVRLERLERGVEVLRATMGEVGRRAVEDHEFACFKRFADRAARMLVAKLDREISTEARAKAKAKARAMKSKTQRGHK